MNSRILFVEDEPVLAEIVQESLQSRGFEVVHAGTCAAALAQYCQFSPEVIILDVMLPDGDGFELAKKIRNMDGQVPIIFLTSKSRTEDVVEGFESGGNDYLKKPFSLEELIVRVKALLNKNQQLTKTSPIIKTVEIGMYLFQYPKGVLTFLGNEKQLTSREAEILQLLVLNKSQVLSRNTLLLNLWGNDDYFSGRSLDVFIAKLRKYLRDDPSVSLLNIRGQGYKLIY